MGIPASRLSITGRQTNLGSPSANVSPSFAANLTRKTFKGSRAVAVRVPSCPLSGALPSFSPRPSHSLLPSAPGRESPPPDIAIANIGSPGPHHQLCPPTMAVGTLSLVFPVFIPASAAAVAYLGHRARFVDWRAWLKAFLTGPGRTSRILLAFFVLTNLKSMPFAWTVSSPSALTLLLSEGPSRLTRDSATGRLASSTPSSTNSSAAAPRYRPAPSSTSA